MKTQWILGDDGLAINLAHYDRLDIKENGSAFDVVAVKDERHIFGSDAVMTYRLYTCKTRDGALDYIKEILKFINNVE